MIQGFCAPRVRLGAFLLLNMDYKEDTIYIKEVNPDEFEYITYFKGQKYGVKGNRKTCQDAIRAVQDCLNILKARDTIPDSLFPADELTEEEEKRINWKVTYPIQYL